MPGDNQIACTDDPDTQTETWTNTTGSTQRVYWTRGIQKRIVELSFSLDHTAPPACSPPTSPTSSSVTTTSATISWTAPGDGTATGGYDYYYSTSNTDPTSGTTPSGSVGAGTTSANLSGLSPNTTYYYWVRSDCSSENSDWTSSASFTTACATQVAPWTESFDGSALTCWTFSATSGGPWSWGPGNWNTYTDYGSGAVPSDNTGNGGTFIYVDHSGTDTDVIAETPEIDVSALSVPMLSFYRYADVYPTPNNFYVEAYNGSTWSVIGTYTTGTDSWQAITIDLSSNVYNPIKSKCVSVFRMAVVPLITRIKESMMFLLSKLLRQPSLLLHRLLFVKEQL